MEPSVPLYTSTAACNRSRPTSAIKFRPSRLAPPSHKAHQIALNCGITSLAAWTGTSCPAREADAASHPLASQVRIVPSRPSAGKIHAAIAPSGN